VPLTEIQQFLLDALERMREPDADTHSPTGERRLGWGIRIGARFAPFFSRYSNQLRTGHPLDRARRRWPLALFIGGALLLCYVGAQYFSMWHEQHVFAQEWTQQSSGSSPVRAPIVVNGESGIARLTIPKLDLHAIVIEGTSYRALKAGPGHLVETPLPGDDGNSVLAGHRDTFFRGLNELVKGDSIVVERQGRTYRFTVAGRKITEPGDVSVLHSSAEPRLTLITCYPPHFIGTAPKRLVVLGELAEMQESGLQGH
jgi:sortase A